jgi:Fuc2NAc and GlcNAc transferase
MPLLGDSPTWLPLLAYALGGLAIAWVSWLDDLRPLPNRVRLSVHLLGASIAVAGIGAWNTVDLPLSLPLRLGWLGLPITLLWIVGLTNAYNFMDGIDGLAGSQAVVAGCGWVILGWLSGQPLVMVLGLLLASATLGFLGHNWSPATIFMGDVGSAFLGYSFATLTVLASQGDPRLALAGVLLVWLFLFDTAFTIVRRLRNGENIFVAHRSHLYQRLVIAGYTHRTVTSVYIVLALVGLLLAVAWRLSLSLGTAALLVCLPLCATGIWLFVVRQEQRVHKVKQPLLHR